MRRRRPGTRSTRRRRQSLDQAAEPPILPTPRASCGPGLEPGARHAGTNGARGRRLRSCRQGLLVQHERRRPQGDTGGFKVQRFVDPAGHECAYYDTTLLFPTNALTSPTSRPASRCSTCRTRRTRCAPTTLVTPAMQSPHESLQHQRKRGLLAAVLGNPSAVPGRRRRLRPQQGLPPPGAAVAACPVGLLGHESGFAPGRHDLLRDLDRARATRRPSTSPTRSCRARLERQTGASHGMTVSDDGNRGYFAAGGAGHRSTRARSRRASQTRRCARSAA